VLALLGEDHLPAQVQERLALDLVTRTGSRGPVPFLADACARIRLNAAAAWRGSWAASPARYRPGTWLMRAASGAAGER